MIVSGCLGPLQSQQTETDIFRDTFSHVIKKISNYYRLDIWILG